VSISKGCSDCYWQAAEYGYKHCKTACITSWCSKSCLECAKGFDADGCAGFSGPAPEPCDSEEALPPAPLTGACSADDQVAINAKGGGDVEGHFPKITSDCGHKALNIFKGIDEDKFNTCLTGEVSISKGCSDCYWQAAEYGYKHCKTACITSWCSKSCLECAKGFDADGCAGFSGPAPEPCSSEEALAPLIV